jgi:hypothetical protein
MPNAVWQLTEDRERVLSCVGLEDVDDFPASASFGIHTMDTVRTRNVLCGVMGEECDQKYILHAVAICACMFSPGAV